MEETIQQRIFKHVQRNRRGLDFANASEVMYNLCHHFNKELKPKVILSELPLQDVHAIQGLVDMQKQLYYLAALAEIDLDFLTAQNLQIIER